MHICDYGVGVDISIIHACISEFKSNIHQSIIITLHYTGSKFQQAIYQENIQPPQIKIKFFEEFTYNTNKYWPYLNGFLLGHKIINLGPVAPGAQLGTYQKRPWHQKSLYSWQMQLNKDIFVILINVFQIYFIWASKNT